MRKLVYLLLGVMLLNLVITGYANPNAHYDDMVDAIPPPPFYDIQSIDTYPDTIVVTYGDPPGPPWYFLYLADNPDGFGAVLLDQDDAFPDLNTLTWDVSLVIDGWPGVFFLVETSDGMTTVDLYPEEEMFPFAGPDFDVLPEFKSQDFVILPFLISLLAILVQYQRKSMTH